MTKRKTATHDWKKDSRSISECIQDWREQRGWTLMQTADALGMSYHSLVNTIYSKGRGCIRENQNRRIMTMGDMLSAINGNDDHLFD